MSVLVYDCGSVENTVTAILDTESGAMIIRGNGDIDNYADESSPWYSEHSDILQVTVDKGITRIGSGTLYGCENLSFVEIANTVTTIGADVFQNCTSLTSIKIPKSITDIGNGTFADSGLTEVKFYGNPPNVGTDIFDGVTADIYTPEGNEEWTETVKGTVAGNGSNLTWKEFDSKPNLIEYDELDYLWSKIKKYVDNNVSVTQVVSSGTKIATITVNGVATDIYSSGGLSGTVGSSTTPIYIDNGVPTACGGSLDVDITGNAATATTASKLSNTTAIGNVSTPVYINANGVPTACNKFASASIAASDSTKTPAGWFRIFSLTGYENGIIIVGGGGYGVSAPCYAILSFSISNNRPNISLISSGNTTTGAGGSTTKIRITCSTSARYVEAYNNPTEQTRNQFFRIFTNEASVTGYNITAGSSPNGEELTYTATVDINKNVEPCLHTTDAAIGSTSMPVYIDANGIAQTCSSFQGSVPIYYVQGPSTDTTAGTWTGSITGLTAYYDGLTVLYVPAVAGASATTLNINSLGAKICYYTNTSALTTHFSVGTPILLTYRDNAWRRADYNSNTTYSAMSVAEGTAGTATTSRTMRADYLKQIIAALPSASCTGASASCTGNAASSTYTSNIRVAKNSASAWYPLVFVTGSTANTNYAPKYHPGLNVDCLDGTTSANGYCFLQLGTATAYGTAGNAYGGIYMYKKATSTYKTPKRVIIVPPNVAAATDADVTLTLPNATGTLALTSSNITGSSASCTGNAATATTATNANKLKTTVVADAKWYSLLGVLYNDASAANSSVCRCSVKMDLGWYNQANSANTSNSLLAYTLLRVGNNTANAANGEGRRGIIRIQSNTTKRVDIVAPDSLSADRTVTLPSSDGTLALTSSNITGSASKWGGYALSVVTSLPASPNASTIYLVK